MTAIRKGGHAFIASGRVKRASDGRSFALCAVCGLVKRFAAHQPIDPRTRATVAHVPAHVPAREAPPTMPPPPTLPATKPDPRASIVFID